MDLKNELMRIKFAFDKVKREMFFLTEKVERVDTQSRKEYDELRREIEILKLKIENNKTNINNSSHEEQHFLVGNSVSKKMHYSNCPYALKISKENLITFNSIKEGLNHGYDRCSCLSD